MPLGDGKPLGVYDANSVRDRICQWQSQGGGVVTTDGLVPEDHELSVKREEHASARKSQPLTPSRKHVDQPTTPRRSARSATKVDDSEKIRTQSGSAPAKRVVSDGHWRKKRSPPKGPTSSRPTENTTPQWALPDEEIRVKPTGDCRLDEKRKVASARTTPRRSGSGGDNDHASPVQVTRSEPRRRSERPLRRKNEEPEHGPSYGNDHEAPASSPKADSEARRRRLTPETSVRKPSSMPKDESRRLHNSIQEITKEEDIPCSTRGTFSDGRGSQRSHKGNILSQVFGDSRKIFSKQAPEPSITPRVPSIEQWLHETPDPFVAANESLIEEILPLRPSPLKRKVTPQETIAEDPNQIWDTLSTKECTRRVVPGSRRRKRIPSSAIYEDNPFPADFEADSGLSSPTKGSQTASKYVDLVKESPEKPPSSPSRRGAKSRKGREAEQDDDRASATASYNTTSSVEEMSPIAPLQPPGLGNRRLFPSTGGHRLSTIASVETFNSRAQNTAPPSVSDVSEQTIHPPPIPEDEDMGEARDQFNPDSWILKSSRLTKHADLISVLSVPRGGGKSIQSARSIRTNRSRLATATVGDLMQELATDETKYMRELRTLVDGVIPVLLTCVLSKSDSAVAADLFRPSPAAHEDPNFTKPIVDMGIALERLKTLHKRIPLKDPTALLTWAHGAQKVYSEYLKAWRMGFQDVVVNLAPAVDSATPNKGPVLEEGLPRSEEGDVTNGDGERVDVAFLLKRPLVRLKYLAKTLKGINYVQHLAEAEDLATKYQRLVDDARRRSNEERARLEDEAAANIDATRARDPRTLAPVVGVVVDRTRRVRARDHFNLALQHSSGQRVDCRVELLFRDEACGDGNGGDLLICEVDGTGRWLLFPPMQLDLVSARNGDLQGEIIVMIRGMSTHGSQWQELFSLVSEDENAGFEWVQMLGLIPVPPSISRSQSFVGRHQRNKSASALAVPSQDEYSLGPNLPGNSRTPSPREVEVPIGEQAHDASKIWTDPVVPSLDEGTATSPWPKDRTRLQKNPQDQFPSTPTRPSTNYVDQVNDLRSLPSQSHAIDPKPSEPDRTPRSFKEALGLSGSSNSMGLRRTRAKRLSRHGDTSPKLSDSQSPFSSPTSSDIERSETKKSAWLGLSSSSNAKDEHESYDPVPKKESIRPPYHRSPSSIPSMDLPHIPKARQKRPPATPITHAEEEPSWSIPPESQLPVSPNRLTKKRPTSSSSKSQTSPTSPVLDVTKRPVLEKGRVKQRRSSSPLKHEYEPSNASDTSSNSGTSTVERNEAMSISDSSDDEELDEGDAPTPLMPLGALKSISKPRTKESLYPTSNGSIKPSDSASQAPYKTVPAQPMKSCKTIASIFSWLDTGCWQSLHPDECSIVITPGLIEAFEMSAAHSRTAPPSSSTPVVDADKFSDLASNATSQNDDVQGERPLVALELTPLVPLRRGTALDISIRSPPTPSSQITSGNNIMFRSRNPEECEALYALINHSRIHNPTYIALQNARGPWSSGGSMPGAVGRRPSSQATNNRSSWFGGLGRSSSYRASSGRTPSLAPSESSIGSMSSAFSALKRFSTRSGGGMFNIAQSTIGSRTGSRANSVYTSSDNSSGSGTSSPIPPGMMVDARKDAPIGLNDAKIRLYIRETASKWRDMGSARLTIMRAESLDGRPVSSNGRPVSSSGRPMSSSGAHQLAHEKRIVVNGKTKGEVLLDAQLGESCFERVARTGIAVSVWEDVLGPNGEVGVVNAVGGVAGGRAKVYMIQVYSILRCKNLSIQLEMLIMRTVEKRG